ncbi:MAG: hypothetical protein KGL59_16585, partial [Acidobacteriota bacterium]|nr:hypothetical protein [Acidobacteriota bacterium]
GSAKRTIAAADSALVSSGGDIYARPGNYCSESPVVLSNGHTLHLGSGMYQMEVAGADSTTSNVSWAVEGAGPDKTTIEACAGANKDVVTDANFATLTGGTNFYGTFRVVISGVTIDGNKTNQTGASYGIRLYGRAARIRNVVVQNCYSDGIWMEWGGTENDTGSSTDVEGQIFGVESIYNGGNGMTVKGAPGGLESLVNFVADENGAWGLADESNIIASHVNTYENGSGGCDVKSASSLQGTDVECTTTTGYGMLVESGAGMQVISSGDWGGGIPLELDGGANSTYEGAVVNAGSGDPGVKITSASVYGLNLVLSLNNNPGTQVDFVAGGGQGTILLSGNAPAGATLFAGTTPGPANIFAYVTSSPSNLIYNQLSTATIYAAGWPDVFPSGNGGVPVSGTLTTTTGTSNSVTIYGVTTSSHCSLTPTNSSAASGITSSYISSVGTNSVTVSHSNSSGMTFNILCTPN